MLKYIRKAIILYLGYFIIFGGLDAIFREIKPLEEYAITALFGTVFVLVLCYFDDKGWNSWKKIGGLFRKKNNEQK
jgi:hypothetical protein